jgi:acetyl-CoA carboxylase biotin carboxyl carrier protein
MLLARSRSRQLDCQLSTVNCLITLESAVQLDLNQLCELLSVLDQTGISELTLKSGEFELSVRKGYRAGELEVQSGGDRAIAAVSPATALTAEGSPQAPPTAATQNPGTQPAAPATVPAAAPVSVPAPNDAKLVPIISPMVGTFYRAPGPDEPPFVEVGDRIKVNQTVCIIEAMKLMNDIEADEVSGQIVEILVQNGEPVEYGQVLMRINPD